MIKRIKGIKIIIMIRQTRKTFSTLPFLVVKKADSYKSAFFIITAMLYLHLKSVNAI